MFIPKRYGQSKVENCPFCSKVAMSMNKQGVPVCSMHKEEILEDLKCICGEALDILKGKFGVFFNCMKCGNMNMRKMMEVNIIKTRQRETPAAKSFSKPSNNSPRTEITVRNDDPRYFD
ncbi:MAG TPA: hypothetical protein VI564_03345 [Candidatus Nanoarchaeia archaeon]|nr:hypothetical protein [Candidatus Nanoarchaeia archaeon]